MNRRLFLTRLNFEIFLLFTVYGMHHVHIWHCVCMLLACYYKAVHNAWMTGQKAASWLLLASRGCQVHLVTHMKKLCRADAVIVSTGNSGESIAERVKEITNGKGAYAAVDAVGGELTGKLLEGVRSQGKLLVYGGLSGLSFSAGIPDVLVQLKVRYSHRKC